MRIPTARQHWMEIQWKWLAIKMYSKSKWVCVYVSSKGEKLLHIFFCYTPFSISQRCKWFTWSERLPPSLLLLLLLPCVGERKKRTILHILFLRRRRRRRCSCLLLLLLHTSFATLRAYVTEYNLFRFYSIKSPISRFTKTIQTIKHRRKCIDVSHSMKITRTQSSTSSSTASAVQWLVCLPHKMPDKT